MSKKVKKIVKDKKVVKVEKVKPPSPTKSARLLRRPKFDKMPKKFKNWKATEQGNLKHRVGTRGHYYIYYKGDYDIDDIREFAQLTSNRLKDDGRIEEIQVGVMYENEGSMSGKSTAVGEDVDVEDLRNRYEHDIGDVTGFFIVI